eukprot:TRINITY_DN31286_c0_g1_i1.p2 TRINITY_DN31286_c0_g1~~TRINITY_DN31286_c0_g1_i1.p2  ORF type:complete len:111 (-),score=17.07 TRINITY_DN31286_c0_g1_i1:529-861(-)
MANQRNGALCLISHVNVKLEHRCAVRHSKGVKPTNSTPIPISHQSHGLTPAFNNANTRRDLLDSERVKLDRARFRVWLGSQADLAQVGVGGVEQSAGLLALVSQMRLLQF